MIINVNCRRNLTSTIGLYLVLGIVVPYFRNKIGITKFNHHSTSRSSYSCNLPWRGIVLALAGRLFPAWWLSKLNIALVFYLEYLYEGE
jgi:hypothetical protein